MKILFVCPEGEDLGGIIPATENTMAALKELGHTVKFALIRTTTNNGDSTNTATDDYVIGEGTNFLSHPVYGWRGKYYSMLNPTAFMQDVKGYDLVVWTQLFGFKCKATKSDMTWLHMLRTVECPQVAMIHDSHINTRGLWYTVLDQFIDGWICVNHTGYVNAKGVTAKPVCLIANGFNLKPNKYAHTRDDSVFSCQTFKSCKNVPELIRAVPHLTQMGIKSYVAGDGIVLRYMKSKDKCPPRYYCSSKNDPDIKASFHGNRIWDNALKSGMIALGAVTETERDRHMKTCKFFIDLSHYPESRGFINRTAIEAIYNGCIPLLDNMTVENEKGFSIFKEDEDYLHVSVEYTPKYLAETIKRYTQLSPKKLKDIRLSGYSKLSFYDRKEKAKELLQFAKGKKAGTFYMKEPLNKSLRQTALQDFQEHFGGTL